ncbi:Leucine-rich repeat protein kinase family protein [Prunus dulcis]|uniref:non-specific serine/threonine protein kinase n=1 Tax=Prunus dulcis TaxID=3755 RepID=A0A4Y1RRG8_PRUDU|nr:Leucine-rich repeat protein kinase family protein [Prunus dulcis]
MMLVDPAAVLLSMKNSWQNKPPSWDKSNDPCDSRWEGVTCNNSRGLSNMSLKGKLYGDIGGLTELRSLILAGCSFNGEIPDELGNLAELSFFASSQYDFFIFPTLCKSLVLLRALNSNNFSGAIPPSLGKLSKLYWLDLADNQLTGTIPISTYHSPGLDLLLKAKHFHLNKNQLSGIIPSKLFSSKMALIHLLLDGNRFTGTIPVTLGLIKTLEVLRLDTNALAGSVPSDLNNLTNVNELDLSNNSFDPSEAPLWFSTLPSLTTLAMEFGSLQGVVPEKLFSLPNLQLVKLKYNAFNDTLNMGDSINPQLQLVDLQNNQISRISPDFSGTRFAAAVLVHQMLLFVSLLVKLQNRKWSRMRAFGQLVENGAKILIGEASSIKQANVMKSCFEKFRMQTPQPNWLTSKKSRFLVPIRP